LKRSVPCFFPGCPAPSSSQAITIPDPFSPARDPDRGHAGPAVPQGIVDEVVKDRFEQRVGEDFERRIAAVDFNIPGPATGQRRWSPVR